MAEVVQDDQDVQNVRNVQTLRVALHFAAHQQALQQVAPAVPNPPVAQPAPALRKNPPLAAWPSPAAWAPAPAMEGLEELSQKALVLVASLQPKVEHLAHLLAGTKPHNSG